VHRDAGPLARFTTREEAEAERDAVLADEPNWTGDLRIETFSFDVADT
jgi:hypothetical protein